MKSLWLYSTLTACALSCCLSSCYHCDEPLWADGGVGVTIVNDWSMAADAQPEGMAYIFYSAGQAQPWRFDFPGTDAGKVMLPEGHYSFVSFNDDTYHTAIDGDDYHSLRAYTWPAQLPHVIDNGQKVAEAPDMLWGCSYRQVDVYGNNVTYIPSCDTDSSAIPVTSIDNILMAHQRQITPRYRLAIEEVENLDGVRSMTAALGGMTGDYIFASGHAEDYPVTLAFDVEAADSTTIAGRFCTFGLPDRHDVPNTLYLFVTLTDERAFIYRFDVTDQVREAPDPMSVDIIIRGLVIEKSEAGAQGGFDVAVDGWITVDVNITD